MVRPLGYKLSEETKKKIGKSNIGKHNVSEETRKRLRESHLGQKAWNKGTAKPKILKGPARFWLGKKRSKEDREKMGLGKKGNHYPKMSLNRLGKKATEITKRRISEGHKGKKHTEEAKQKIKKNHARYWKGKKMSNKRKKKIRESAVRYFQQVRNIPYPCIGKLETNILDKLEENFGYKILRQYKVIGYFLDGYCLALNLAIEIDEQHHNIQKDRIRQINIEKELNCKFLRIEVNN